MHEYPAADRWRLVRGADIPRHLRHLLLVLMHYQGLNPSVWCRRGPIADELGISPDVVSRYFKELESLNVLTRAWKARNGRPSREYSINFTKLALCQRANACTLTESSDCTLTKRSESERSTLTESSGSPWRIGQGHPDENVRHEQPLNNHRTTNRGASLPKESSQKFSEQDSATAKWMFDIVQQLQPEHKPVDLSAWANDISLMRERDGRSDADIRELFAAADMDDFWRKNIRCPAKLRKQWDTLDLKFRKSKPSSRASADFETVRAIVKRIWSPDLKNHPDVEAAIGNRDLFSAAKLTGLSLIADARDGDRDTQSTFDRHLTALQATRKATA